MGEVGAYTYNVCKATLWVTAEFAFVKDVVLSRVCDGTVLAVPAEVPYVAHFPATLGNAPFVHVPDASCKSGGGPLPLGGRAAEGTRVVPSREIVGKR